MDLILAGVAIAVLAVTVVGWRAIESLRTQIGRIEQPDSGVAEIRAQVTTLQQALQAQLAEMQQSVRSQTGETHSAISDVRERLGTLQQQAQRVSELAQNISSLQDLLKPPRLRGALGELWLGQLLSEIAPGHHELQYEFPSTHARVDAVVRLGDRLVPIDAKFPLEMFVELTKAPEEERRVRRREFISAVKRHVDSLAKKYLVPVDGTIDWALMYVPAENVYYELIVRGEQDDGFDLRRYCQERHVIPVSPNTLQAFLAAILLGIQGMTIQARAREIQEMLGQIAQDVARLDGEHEKLGRHLDNARSVHDQTARSIGRLAERLRQASAAPLPEQPTQPALPLDRHSD